MKPLNEYIEQYIDSNGNFTHSKLEGTKEELQQFIQLYKNSKSYKSKTDSQKILMENFIFPHILRTGMVPQGVILELTTEPTTTGFDDVKVGGEITFDLPCRYKVNE